MSTRKRTKQIRACQRKRKYTENGARSVARELNAKGHYLHAYKCPICKGWHVGRPYPHVRVEMAFKRLHAGAYGNGGY